MKTSWVIPIGSIILFGFEVSSVAQGPRPTRLAASAPSPATSVPFGVHTKPTTQWRIPADSDEQTVQLGSASPDSPHYLSLVLSNRGAAIRVAALNRFSEEPDHSGPYPLLQGYQQPTLPDPVLPFASVGCNLNGEQLDLEGLCWRVGPVTMDLSGTQVVEFQTTILRNDEPYLRIAKSFVVQELDYHFGVGIRAENLGREPLSLTLVERGPVGVQPYPGAVHQRDVWAGFSREQSQKVVLERLPFGSLTDQTIGRSHGTQSSLVWAVLANRYFACLVYYGASEEDTIVADWRYDVAARRHGSELLNENGLGLEWRHGKFRLSPGEILSLSADVYLGPLDRGRLVNDPLCARLGYPYVMDRPTAEPYVQGPAGLEGRPSLFCLSSVLGLIMARVLSLVQFIIPSETYGPAVAVILIAMAVRLLLYWPSRTNLVRAINRRRLAGLRASVDEVDSRTRGSATGVDDGLGAGELGVRASNRPRGILSVSILVIHLAVVVGIMVAFSVSFRLRAAGVPLIPGHWIRFLRDPDALVPVFGTLALGPPSLRMVFPSADLHLLPLLLGAVIILRGRYTSSHYVAWGLLAIVLSYFLPSCVLMYLLTVNVVGLVQVWRLDRRMLAALVDDRKLSNGA